MKRNILKTKFRISRIRNRWFRLFRSKQQIQQSLAKCPTQLMQHLPAQLTCQKARFSAGVAGTYIPTWEGLWCNSSICMQGSVSRALSSGACAVRSSFTVGVGCHVYNYVNTLYTLLLLRVFINIVSLNISLIGVNYISLIGVNYCERV